MSRSPNNGPTFSKAPPKRQKPLTDEELQARNDQQAYLLEQAKERAARKKEHAILFNRLIAALAKDK